MKLAYTYHTAVAFWSDYCHTTAVVAEYNWREWQEGVFFKEMNEDIFNPESFHQKSIKCENI